MKKNDTELVKRVNLIGIQLVEVNGKPSGLALDLNLDPVEGTILTSLLGDLFDFIKIYLGSAGIGDISSCDSQEEADMMAIAGAIEEEAKNN